MIVLSMITKNSYRQLGKKFIKTLEKSLQIPYKTIILVDDGDDETSQVVKKFAESNGKELLVLRSKLYGWHKPTRATARQTAIDVFIECFSEEWLMFLDDDAWLNDGWWEEAKKYIIEKRVGEIWGINWDIDQRRIRYLKSYEKHLIECFQKRGGTHDTLYRRKAIEDVKIPPCLHIFEDAYLHLHIICNGWEYRVVRTGITHVNPGRRLSRRGLLESAKFALLLGIEEGYSSNVVKNLLLVLRPIIGFIPNLYYNTKIFGLLNGFKRTVKEQLDKLLYRIYFFYASIEYSKYLSVLESKKDKCIALNMFRCVHS